MPLPSSQRDREYKNFSDRLDGNTDRLVKDTALADKLDDVITAIEEPLSPTVYNVAVTLADDEVSFALPANCKKFFFRSRKISRLKFGYAPGVSTTYITIPLGGYWSESSTFVSQTIYFESSVANNTIEIIVYE
jgi:hypothetical protein